MLSGTQCTPQACLRACMLAEDDNVSAGSTSRGLELLCDVQASQSQRPVRAAASARKASLKEALSDEDDEQAGASAEQESEEDDDDDDFEL